MPKLPYTNFHDLNLNWFLKEFKKIIESVTKKQDAPTQPGTAGQVLGLNDGLQPVWVDQEGGSQGTTNYTELENKPQINGITLAGNKTGSALGLMDSPAVGTSGQVLTTTGAGAYSWQDLPEMPEPSEPEVTIIRPASGNTFTLEPCPVTYAFGEKAELTVTVTANSEYHFSFSCPAGTPTVLTILGATTSAGDDTLEAGGYYEINIWDGIALYRKLEVTAG